jgi:hypothetical protein
MRTCANCGAKLLKQKTSKGYEEYPSLDDLKIMYADKRDRDSAMIYDVACFWIEKIKIPADKVICEECFWK